MPAPGLGLKSDAEKLIIQIKLQNVSYLQLLDHGQHRKMRKYFF